MSAWPGPIYKYTESSLITLKQIQSSSKDLNHEDRERAVLHLFTEMKRPEQYACMVKLNQILEHE